MKILKILEPVLLIFFLFLLVFTALKGVEQTALLSVLFIILSMLPFFLRFEHSRPKPRDIVPIVVMSLIAALGRLAFTFLPGFQPVTAIVIITGIVFGPQSGFMAGALTAFTSNMFMGQGPWTPWQMLGWALTGYLAGILKKTPIFKKKIFIYIFGAIISIIYGWFLNIWVVVGFVKPITWQAVASTYALSIYVDILHAVSTVAFLILTLGPWERKLSRIKTKFGLIDPRT
jgi:energy-coupling factor transport system substrate-specific component